MFNLYLLNISPQNAITEPEERTIDLFYLSTFFEFLIIILAAGTLIYFFTKNKYISLLFIPPIYYVISVSSSVYPQNLRILLLTILLQLIIITLIERFKMKKKVI